MHLQRRSQMRWTKEMMTTGEKEKTLVMRILRETFLLGRRMMMMWMGSSSAVCLCVLQCSQHMTA